MLNPLTLSNINWFSKFFHCQNQEKICNNIVTKDPTTPQVSQVCRYTTLWNVWTLHGCFSGYGRTTTVVTCTCCLNTYAGASYSRTCAMPASSQTAPVCSTPPRSHRLSTTFTLCPSSTETSNRRISCSTRTVTSSSQTSDSPRGLRTGLVI